MALTGTVGHRIEMAIDEQAVLGVDTRSDPHDDVLQTAVHVGHPVEELQGERSAHALHVQLDHVIGSGVFDDGPDFVPEQVHGENFVRVAAGYPRAEPREVPQLVVRPLRHEPIRILVLLGDFYPRRELFLDDYDRREHDKYQRQE